MNKSICFSTYFTLYEVQSPLRGKIRSIQLVSLIRSKFWKKHGNLKANEILIKDLHLLENVGVKVLTPTVKYIKAGLGAIVGDNLGKSLIIYDLCAFKFIIFLSMM